MKQVKHHNFFIYYTNYKFSSVTLTTVKPEIWKIDLKAFFFLRGAYDKFPDFFLLGI